MLTHTEGPKELCYKKEILPIENKTIVNKEKITRKDLSKCPFTTFF
jgi:hypothetical protein